MLPDAALFGVLVLLGGWVAVDATSLGQFMVSRPLVAAALSGWLAGDPVAGAAIGLVLEAFQLTVLPVGAARYPEGGPAAVVAGALVARSGLDMPSVLTAVSFVLGWEWLSGESVRALRHLNIRLVSPGARPLADVRDLERRHRSAVAIDFARGMLLVAAGLLVLSALLYVARLHWGLGERIPRVLLAAVVAGLLASAMRLFGPRHRLFLVGLLAGGLVLLVRS